MITHMEPLDTKGRVLHSEARYYDVLAWMLTLGRERAFRERLTDLAELRPGAAVLDVGCGTGTLAISAKQRVGASGTVIGIDASPEMIERAKQKAVARGVEVKFQTAIVEALPFPDASFDVVFNTLMLHHLPRAAREQCAREMRRVLVPGGRIVAVDFAVTARERKGLLARLHRHGQIAPSQMVDLLIGAGSRVEKIGTVGVSDLHFVIAVQPTLDATDDALPSTPTVQALDRLPTPRWIWAALAVVVLAVHGVVIRGVSSRLTLSVVALTGLVVLIAVLHSSVAGLIHTMLRRRKQRPLG